MRLTGCGGSLGSNLTRDSVATINRPRSAARPSSASACALSMLSLNVAIKSHLNASLADKFEGSSRSRSAASWRDLRRSSLRCSVIGRRLRILRGGCLPDLLGLLLRSLLFPPRARDFQPSRRLCRRLNPEAELPDSTRGNALKSQEPVGISTAVVQGVAA